MKTGFWIERETKRCTELLGVGLHGAHVRFFSHNSKEWLQGSTHRLTQ